MFCSNCGNEIHNEWNVCPQCGMKVNPSGNNESVAKQSKQKAKTSKKIWVLLSAILVLLLGAVTIGINVNLKQQKDVIDKLQEFTIAYKDENRCYFDDVAEAWTLIYTAENEVVNFKNDAIKQDFIDLFGNNCYSESGVSNLGFAFDLSDNEALFFLNVDIDDGHLSIVAYSFEDDEYRAMIDGEWWDVTDEFIDFVKEQNLLSAMEADISKFKSTLKQNGLTISELLKIEYDSLKEYGSFQEKENDSHEAKDDIEDIQQIKDAYVGTWYDTYSQRCGMIIESEDGINYDIEIHWSSNAWESSAWYLKGIYDADSRRIEYSGKQVLEVYTESGEYFEKTICDNEIGRLYYDDHMDSLFWEDDRENVGESCVFEKEVTIPEDVRTDWYLEFNQFYSEDTKIRMVIDAMDNLYVAFYRYTNQEECLKFGLEPDEVGDRGELIYYGETASLKYYPAGVISEQPSIRIETIYGICDGLYTYSSN